MKTIETNPFSKGVLNNSDQSTIKNKTILLKYKRNNRQKNIEFLFIKEQKAGLKIFYGY